MANSAVVDEAIIASVGPSWTKVAMVIARASRAVDLGLPENESEFEFLGARVEELVASGNLLLRGDPKEWRSSEVRRV